MMDEQYWAVLTELNELKADLRKLAETWMSEEDLWEGERPKSIKDAWNKSQYRCGWILKEFIEGKR